MGTPNRTPCDEAIGRAAERAKAGDTGAWLELYRLYGRRVIALLIGTFKVPREAAEDSAQEVWLRVFRALPAWQADDFCAWAFVIIRNVAAEHWRRAARAPGGLDAAPDPASDLPPADRRAEDEDELRKFRDCFDRLPPDDRAVLRGRMADKSYEQLAAEFADNVPNMRKRAFRARQQVRACMGGDRE
jgi:RNA polymerase sigma factor (sigma-70 family)